MNIAVDIRCLMTKERTGVAVYTFELLDALFKVDTQNSYYLFYNSHKDVDQFLPTWDYKHVHFVKYAWPNKLLNMCMWLLKYPKLDTLISKKVDKRIDYFFSPNIHFLALSKQVKHILTIHDLSYELFTECYSKKRRLWHALINPKKQCERANIIVCPSERTRLDVIAHFNISKEKVHTVYSGIPRKAPSNIEGVKTLYSLPQHFVLFVGTLEPRKNIIAAIKAFVSRKQVLDAGYECIIAGPRGWHDKEILDLIDQYKQVRYIGYVDDSEKQSLYGLADAFVFPSIYEGFGFPVLEAMRAGTPVITSDRSALPEVVGDAAYVVNPLDINAIGLAIERVLDEENLRNMFIEKGTWRSSVFIWKKTAQQFISLYENRN